MAVIVVAAWQSGASHGDSNHRALNGAKRGGVQVEAAGAYTEIKLVLSRASGHPSKFNIV